MTERDKGQIAITVILVGLVGGFAWGVAGGSKTTPTEIHGAPKGDPLPADMQNQSAEDLIRRGEAYLVQRDKRSPALREYETLAEPIDQKIGNANNIVICRLRDTTWLQAVTENLEEYRNGPLLGSLQAALTPEELREAQGFDIRTYRNWMKYTLPHGLADCPELARMPFVYNDANFLP